MLLQATRAVSGGGGNGEPPRFSDVTTVEGVRPLRNAMPAVTLATLPVIVTSGGISQPQKSNAQNNNKGYSSFLL